MRPLLETSLSLIERQARGDAKTPKLVIQAPTGYGKSVAAPLVASRIFELGLASMFVHSLPLRAIVRDVYLCSVLNALLGSEELSAKCGKRREVLDMIREALGRAGVSAGDVAYQMGEHLGAYGRKEPLFDAKYVVTTLDSLVYNLFRLPVSEIFSYKKHYAIPRARLYISALYLDEVHSVAEDAGSSSRLFTLFKILLEVAAAARMPLVLASATVPERLEEELLRALGEGALVVKLGEENASKGREVLVRDRDYEGAALSVRWATKIVEESSVVEKVVEHYQSGERVFVALDSLRRAVEYYSAIVKRIPEDEVELVHSMFTDEDRSRKLERLREVKVLVATSVVEAGVDVSFDVLITDSGNPISVVQRAGRVCRNLDCDEATIYLVHRQGECEDLVELVASAGNIDWRLPYDKSGRVSYAKLLKGYNVPPEDDSLRATLRSVLNPLVVSSETLNRVLRRYGYAISREVLATATVMNVEEIESSTYAEVLGKSLTVALDRLEGLGSCLRGFYAIVREGGGSAVRAAEVSRSCLPGLENYVCCLEKAHKEFWRELLLTTFLVDKECYSSRVGLLPG